MNCPKCEQGTIDKIIFKKSNKGAYVCDFCEALWLEGENIGITSNHTLGSFSQDEDLGYAIADASGKDQDHQPVRRVAI